MKSGTKGELNTKFHITAVYDEKYIKAKVREFRVRLKQTF